MKIIAMENKYSRLLLTAVVVSITVLTLICMAGSRDIANAALAPRTPGARPSPQTVDNSSGKFECPDGVHNYFGDKSFAQCPDGSEPVFISGNPEIQGTPNPEDPRLGDKKDVEVPNQRSNCSDWFENDAVINLTVLCGAGNDSLSQLISGVANVLVALIVFFIIIMIVVSGIQMAASAGNPEAIKGAKKRLINALISLALLLSTRAILAFLGVKIR